MIVLDYAQTFLFIQTYPYGTKGIEKCLPFKIVLNHCNV